jgi:hypothetical protein
MNTSTSWVRPIRALGSYYFALIVIAAPAFAADPPAVTGVWEYKDPAVAANSITFTLNPDGTGKVDDDAVTYTVSGNTIKIVTGGETVAYTFKIDGDTMTVAGGDLDKPTPFTRKNATPKKGLGAKIKNMAAADPAKTEAPKPDDAKTDTPPAQPKAAAAPAGPVGTWQSADGDQMEIRADALVYRGVTIPATLTAQSLKINANGQTVECPFEITGDAMNITIGGQALALKRVGGGGPPVPENKPAEKKPEAGAAATDAKTLAGTWDGPEGTVIIRPDGTTRTGGQEYKYTVDAQFITLSDDKNYLKIPYKLDGDKLILGTGPTKTLTRSAGGPAGVWVVTESSLDPQFFMSITHYLSLYPDGTVGFAKTEGGATRTAVTENLERFSSFKNKTAAAAAGKTYGRWQVDADGVVTIQWSGAFKNATWQGRIDPKTGKLALPHAGILNEGQALAYEKQ